MHPFERLFMRIGLSDSWYLNKSTFFIEMQEIAEILRFSTKASICFIDELGSGTSTGKNYFVC